MYKGDDVSKTKSALNGAKTTTNVAWCFNTHKL